MDAYDAMKAILDCNEMIEKLKISNNDNIPDMNKITITSLLSCYRDLLIKLMRGTELGVYKDDN